MLPLSPQPLPRAIVFKEWTGDTLEVSSEVENGVQGPEVRVGTGRKSCGGGETFRTAGCGGRRIPRRARIGTFSERTLRYRFPLGRTDPWAQECWFERS